jgi:hypothetical protein
MMMRCHYSASAMLWLQKNTDSQVDDEWSRQMPLKEWLVDGLPVYVVEVAMAVPP